MQSASGHAVEPFVGVVTEGSRARESVVAKPRRANRGPNKLSRSDAILATRMSQNQIRSDEDTLALLLAPSQSRRIGLELAQAPKDRQSHGRPDRNNSLPWSNGICAAYKSCLRPLMDFLPILASCRSRNK